MSEPETPAEPKKKSFFDQLKEATSVVVEKTRDGVEDLQQKRELSDVYEELGVKAAELVRSGAIANPELAPLVARADELEAALAVPPAAEEPPAAG